MRENSSRDINKAKDYAMPDLDPDDTVLDLKKVQLKKVQNLPVVQRPPEIGGVVLPPPDQLQASPAAKPLPRMDPDQSIHKSISLPQFKASQFKASSRTPGPLKGIDIQDIPTQLLSAANVQEAIQGEAKKVLEDNYLSILFKWIIQQYHKRNVTTWLVFFLVVYVIVLIKFVTIQVLDNNIFFNIYSILVSVFILSRFCLAYFYDPHPSKFDKNYRPTITFGIPAKNEEGNIKETINKIVQIYYPKDKFDIVVINDGSTDNTLEEMYKAQAMAAEMDVRVKVVDWKENKGKREGMGECVRQSDSEIVFFVDSDSFIDPHTPKEIIKYFYKDEVAGVAGHAYVANAEKNMLTKMQAVRYYVAFKAYKASEALFGNVTCCSGCCSAYRKRDLLEVLDPWLHQTFLGIRCTYGDDRSLTNYLLRKGKVTLYAPEAISYTIVPDGFKKFMNQQLRWKKSWLRESWEASKFMWRKNPLMATSFYLSITLPLLAPFIVARALVWYPILTHKFPFFYIFGLGLMAVVYGLYYYVYTKDKKWTYGVLFASFYTIVLIWQIPFAVLNIRDSRWGTR